MGASGLNPHKTTSACFQCLPLKQRLRHFSFQLRQLLLHDVTLLRCARVKPFISHHHSQFRLTLFQMCNLCKYLFQTASILSGASTGTVCYWLALCGLSHIRYLFCRKFFSRFGFATLALQQPVLIATHIFF